MADPLRVSDVRFTAASKVDQRQGLLGFVRCVLGEALAIDGLVLRRTRQGSYVFSWPGRYDRRGIFRHSVRPLHDAARRALEDELLAQLFPQIRAGAA
jgi:hypothetical protein